MKANKLTLEEREEILALSQSSGWEPFMKALEILVQDREQAVLKYNIDEGVERLVHTKLRAEGARKLVHDIQELIAKLKKQEQKG